VRGRRWRLAMVIALALLGTACGDDDDTAETDEEQAMATTADGGGLPGSVPAGGEDAAAPDAVLVEVIRVAPSDHDSA
jgi:hypothetical protein